MSAIVLSVEYQVGGGQSEPTLTKLVTAFERAGAEVADVGKHVMPKLLPVLEAATGRQFSAQGTGPSGSWAPLSPKYAAWKAVHYPGQPLLVREGKLLQALTDGGSGNALREVSGGSLSFGTKGVPYASVKQTGSSREPARPPFDFDGDFERDMQAAAAAGVREAVREGSDGLLDFEGDTFEGLPVLTGAHGGRYVPTSGGGRRYLKRNAAGQVVTRNVKGKK